MLIKSNFVTLKIKFYNLSNYEFFFDPLGFQLKKFFFNGVLKSYLLTKIYSNYSVPMREIVFVVFLNFEEIIFLNILRKLLCCF